MRSVELFAGAGGSALGTSMAGFRHDVVVERDANACQTLRLNKKARTPYVVDWRIHQDDVRRFDYSGVPEGVDLLVGGPPCQPFSLGGKHGGHRDSRNMFPEMARAVRELRPRAVMVENVRGLVRPSFERYFEYIILQLTYPEVVRANEEAWEDHAGRLERIHTSRAVPGLCYQIVFSVLNAADYGIPQRRERVFIIGFRSDLGIEWSFPRRTHSLDELLRQQWVTGEYWQHHEVARRQRPDPPERYSLRIQRQRGRLEAITSEAPWRTVRDCFVGLPEPRGGGTPGVANHDFIDGARIYPGHTGSPLDEPAKTLKAGDHGVPGGENMLARPDGSVRYFTVRECARLQAFPDDFFFHGSRTEIMRQLGNAVPVTLAKLLAKSIAKALAGRD